MGCTDEDVRTLIIDDWAPGIGLELTPASRMSDRPRHTARAAIRGDWVGELEVVATAAFGRAVAGALHELPPVTVDEAAAAAAVRELAAAVAGRGGRLLGAHVSVEEAQLKPDAEPLRGPVVAQAVCSAGAGATAEVRFVGASVARR